MRLLIVEDNPDIAANIGDFLLAKGHIVDFAGNGPEGLRLATACQFDTVILDINLPRMDGFELCRRLRNEFGVDTPVLMLTARGTLADKASGFEAGAWDYLVKPFALEELLMRLDALSLRHDARRETVVRFGELSLDIGSRQATRAGVPLNLRKASLRILEMLIRAAPNVVSRGELEYMLWGGEPPGSNPLRSHLHELRKALDKPFD
ncbi:MAG: response regulator transcription factor, partial [Pseudomonadota bacterium]